jgi:hypothetical protein
MHVTERERLENTIRNKKGLDIFKWEKKREKGHRTQKFAPPLPPQPY